jgi:hypothetical protein
MLFSGNARYGKALSAARRTAPAAAGLYNADEVLVQVPQECRPPRQRSTPVRSDRNKSLVCGRQQSHVQRSEVGRNVTWRRCHQRSAWLSDILADRSFCPISQTNRNLLYREKIAPKTRLRPEVNALPDLGLLAQMKGDSVHAISRRNFSGRNTGERYFYLRAGAPDFQVISAVNHFIRNTEKSPLLQEIDPEPDQNANRNYMDDGLVENAFVNDGWCSHRGDKRRRT